MDEANIQDSVSRLSEYFEDVGEEVFKSDISDDLDNLIVPCQPRPYRVQEISHLHLTPLSDFLSRNN